MNPARLLIAFVVLSVVLAGLAAWERMLGDAKATIAEIGDDRDAIQASHDYVASLMLRFADPVFTETESRFNDKLGQWVVTGKVIETYRPSTTRTREYLCRISKSGVRWQCNWLDIDGNQRWPQEDEQ